MKTKFLYAIVSGNNDYFYEQVWVSAFSLKHHNPDAHIIVVADRATYDNINSTYRRSSLDLIDELVPIEIEGDYTNMQKSRWIKTNLRNLVDGDYLFIDGDTIITDNLSSIDDLSCDIGMVLDYHTSFKNNWNVNREVNAAKRIFNKDCSLVEKYYNSGVIYCKDNLVTREFYRNWHENWKVSDSHGHSFDQLSLMITGLEYPNVLKEIGGIFNCQITIDLNYLVDAKIVHFFSSTSTSFTPFKCKDTYLQIKKEGYINDNLKSLIINCKRRFNGPIYIMTNYDKNSQDNSLYKLYAALRRRKDKWYVRSLEWLVSLVVSKK